MSHKLNIKTKPKKAEPQKLKSYEEAALPDKPSEKHTVLITCKGEAAGGEPGCKRKRWCKPQDAWQVKLCLACKKAKDAIKAGTSIAKLKARVEAKQTVEKAATYIRRLTVWKFIWPTPAEIAKYPKLKRIWP